MSTATCPKGSAEWTLDDAISILTSTHPTLETAGDNELLCLRKKLDDQPLALVLASAYMQEMNCSVQDYMGEIERRLTSVASSSIDDAAEPVFAAFQLSFQLARSENPRAADILSIMSVLETSAVPEAMLYHHENDTVRSYHAAVRKLRAFALVQVSGDETTLFLDATVQSWVQAELRRQHALSKWRGVAVKILSKAFPHGDSNYWRACDALMPHVRKVLAYDVIYKEGDDALRMKHALLLRNVASFLELRSDFDAALDKLNDALKMYGSDDRPDDHEYGSDERRNNSLAVEEKIVQMLLYQEKLAEAEERAATVRTKLMKASEGRETRRLEALQFSNTLATILARRGKHKEAKKLYLEALEANLALRHSSNADAFNIRNNLASLYVDMGDYQAAESETREVLTEQEKIFGPKHHNTIFTKRLLAKAMSAQGHYAAAAEKDEEALAAAEEVLGTRHSDTVGIKSDLAQLAGKLGDYKKSEMLHRDVLEIRLESSHAQNTTGQEDSVGAKSADKPSIINSRLGLGVALEMQGRYDEAAAMLELASESALNVLGEKDPITLKVRSTLGLAYLRLGDFPRAESMIKPLLAVNQELYGDKHFETLGARNNLGGCLQRQGRWEDAIYHHRKTMEAAADPEILGPKHPFSLRSRNNVAEVLRESAEWKLKDPEQDRHEILQVLKEAEELQLQAWEGRREVLGPDHPDTLTSSFNLGQVFHAQKRYPEALERYQSALEGFSRIPNAQFPIMRDCKKKMAILEQEMQSQAAAALPKESS